MLTFMNDECPLKRNIWRIGGKYCVNRGGCERRYKILKKLFTDGVLTQKIMLLFFYFIGFFS